MKNKIQFIIFIHFCFNYLNANSIDSLKNVISKSSNDSIKIATLISIGDYFEYVNSDSAIFYYNKAISLSDQIIDNNKGNKNIYLLKSNALRYIGLIHFYIGNFDISLSYYYKSLDICLEISYNKGISKCYNNIGVAYEAKGNFDKSLIYYFKAIKINEIDSNYTEIAKCNNNIGNVYSKQSNYEKALKYYNESLLLNQRLNIKSEIAICFNNIGNTYYNLKQIDSSLKYFLLALDINNELGNKFFIASNYLNIGSVYFQLSNYKKAHESFINGLNLYNEIQDKNGISNSYSNLAALFYHEDSIKNMTKAEFNYIDSAISYGLKAFKIAEEISSVPIKNDIADILKKSYTKNKNFSEALNYANIYIETQANMYNENSAKALYDAEQKFETEKKQLQIENLEKDNILKKTEIQKQRILNLSFITGFIIILTFSIFIYRLFLQKKKANQILSQQKAKIIAQRDEIETQRDLVTRQKEEIEVIHEELTDSINYAKRIQQAILPELSIEPLSKFQIFPKQNHEKFILFKPKDIVSGDFYWVTKVNEWLIVAVADCTGHGVPGAFMSILGISFLNEIVRKKEITQASKILNELRNEVINALQQKGSIGEQKDGMDISILAINQCKGIPISELENESSNIKLSTNQLIYNAQWAGANNPLWVVKSPKFQTQNSKSQGQEQNSLDLGLEAFFLELKADKMPIAIYDKMNDFTNHELQLNEGDILYLMSDGYEDQFGGPKGKKFLSKNLKQLLLDNSQKSMNEQKQILEKTLIEWIGDGEQIDDITILGIKI